MDGQNIGSTPIHVSKGRFKSYSFTEFREDGMLFESVEWLRKAKGCGLLALLARKGIHNRSDKA